MYVIYNLEASVVGSFIVSHPVLKIFYQNKDGAYSGV